MRVLSSIAILGVLLAATNAGPVSAEEGGLQRDEEQIVLATEDEYVAAEIARDEEALRRLVDDRFAFNSSDGSASGKEDLIQAVLAMNMTGQNITDRSVMVEGDLAIVFGTTELRTQASGAEERLSMYRYTSVYVKRQDQWRMLALHMAPR